MTAKVMTAKVMTAKVMTAKVMTAKYSAILTLFTIALLGLTIQLLRYPDWPSRLLAIALLLLGADQTRMAIVDLHNIQVVQVKIGNEPRLAWFEKITWSTIALELLGFYLGWWQVGWGTIVVLLSQVWFNCLAGVQLWPQRHEVIQSFGISDRGIVLLADLVGLFLASLWVGAIAPLGMAIALLSMVVIYLGVKYAETQATSATNDESDTQPGN